MIVMISPLTEAGINMDSFIYGIGGNLNLVIYDTIFGIVN